MDRPLVEFLALVGAVGLVLAFLLYISGNFHCVNFPIFGLKCAIG